MRGLWNDEFLRVLENFPAGRHDDEVDALSGAYEQIGGRGGPFEYERGFIRRSCDPFSYLDRKLKGALLY